MFLHQITTHTKTWSAISITMNENRNLLLASGWSASADDKIPLLLEYVLIYLRVCFRFPIKRYPCIQLNSLLVKAQKSTPCVPG